MGQFHHVPLMGPELQMASYGPKDIMGHTWSGSYNGLESYWTAQMKLLGLIQIGRKWAIYEQTINRLSVGRPVTF